MSKRTLSTLASLGAVLTPVLIFLFKHRALIADMLDLIPDILRYAADPPPEPEDWETMRQGDKERDVTPKGPRTLLSAQKKPRKPRKKKP